MTNNLILLFESPSLLNEKLIESNILLVFAKLDHFIEIKSNTLYSHPFNFHCSTKFIHLQPNYLSSARTNEHGNLAKASTLD